MHRLFKHLMCNRHRVEKLFSKSDLQAIAQAITESETKHSGEIVFYIEPSLSLGQIFAKMTSRERALEGFSAMRVWDTEANNGVMLYFLVAERKFEIIADRGVNRLVDQSFWNEISRAISQQFSERAFTRGVIEAIQKISEVLQKHFPPRLGDRNELADEVQIV